ncbi:ankyrin repeat-containing protein At5g02620-like [Malania oleifera]|uniref:ankyrin repeat-containing protein At5g02620-like n=1 Tax=Malania oleifera TaxID=397392 RepID=UPI0025AE7BF2|nr:ankyrin repeat-containing protein At5g02620-like [Malania oleifera]
MEGKLEEVMVSGSAEKLNELIKEDPFIIDRALIRAMATSCGETPLHVATILGHRDLASELVRRKPSLASEVDWLGRTPLHLASARGFTHIVRQLLFHADHSSIHLACDRDGRTPLHLAAIEGQTEVIEELCRRHPTSIGEKSSGGQTVLHLCVKYDRLEALKLLVESASPQFVMSKDDDGNTILHLAAYLQQAEILKYLVSSGEVFKDAANALNKNRFTALDVLEYCPNKDFKFLETCALLQEAGVRRAKDLPSIENTTHATETANDVVEEGQITAETNPTANDVVDESQITAETNPPLAPPKSRIHRFGHCVKLKWKEWFPTDDEWKGKTRKALFVSASVIVSMAYQAGLNPPGAVWQEVDPKIPKDGKISEDSIAPEGAFASAESTPRPPPNYAGKSIGGTMDKDCFDYFSVFNTLVFILGVSVIMLQGAGIPLMKSKFRTWLSGVTVCLTMSFVVLAYFFGTKLVAPDKTFNTVIVGVLSIFNWELLLVLLLYGFFTLAWVVRIVFAMCSKGSYFLTRLWRSQGHSLHDKLGNAQRPWVQEQEATA